MYIGFILLAKSQRVVIICTIHDPVSQTIYQHRLGTNRDRDIGNVSNGHVKCNLSLVYKFMPMIHQNNIILSEMNNFIVFGILLWTLINFNQVNLIYIFYIFTVFIVKHL